MVVGWHVCVLVWVKGNDNPNTRGKWSKEMRLDYEKMSAWEKGH